MNKTEYIGKLNALYVGDKNCLEELITIYDEKDKEIEKLNNIINELETYIGIKMSSFGICNASDIYYKLQELKGSNEPSFEEDKKIEKLEIVHNGSANAYALLNEYGTKCALTKHSKVMCDKINEIIDKLNEMEKE